MTNSEIDLLVRAARDERAEAMGEILSQDVEFISDFMALLTITPGSHPQTYRVLHIGSLSARSRSCYFKDRYKRARPSHFCPALMPPIPTPGHSAYPSGHATQAFLMALLMRRVLSGTVPAADLPDFVANLSALARRVARNREIAGVHYRSDSTAGDTLA